MGSSVRARPRGLSLRRGLSRARLARARVTLRSPHGGWGSNSGSGGGGALSPRQQHVEQPLTLAAAALRWLESSRHLGARTLGIEIPLQPYPLLDRLDDGSLHLAGGQGDAAEIEGRSRGDAAEIQGRCKLHLAGGQARRVAACHSGHECVTKALYPLSVTRAAVRVRCPCCHARAGA